MEYKLSINASDAECVAMLGKLIKLDTIKIIVNGESTDEVKVATIKALLGGDNDELG